eukprot:TRINITY_DN68248_c0_g1_i1.p2 TRINITY_DN68248_c0_g1~~TRINITY_DN68248_c0_g1_i1.p2  ORF type:complete len:216 (+),score=46.05 TRINITY_DN68248_c0_g1_i1:34-648(+)
MPVEVTYFGVKAKVAFATVAFAAGIDWKYNKMAGDAWPATKATTTFGQLPIMKDDGVECAQSLAICHYIAKKGGLLGDTDADYVMSEQILQHAEDIYAALIKNNPRLTQKEKLPSYDDFWAKDVPAMLAGYEKLVKDGKFTSKVTLGECGAFWALELMVSLKPACLDGTPGVKAFYDRFAGEDAGKKYLAWLKDNEVIPYFFNP